MRTTGDLNRDRNSYKKKSQKTAFLRGGDLWHRFPKYFFRFFQTISAYHSCSGFARKHHLAFETSKVEGSSKRLKRSSSSHLNQSIGKQVCDTAAATDNTNSSDSSKGRRSNQANIMHVNIVQKQEQKILQLTG